MRTWRLWVTAAFVVLIGFGCASRYEETRVRTTTAVGERTVIE